MRVSSSSSYTHISCIVRHSELCALVGRGHVNPRPLGATAQRLVQLEGERGIGGPGKPTLLVQDGQQANILRQEDIENGRVAGVGDGVERHALFLALLLFPLEDALVEVLLQLLVGHIDTHLIRGEERF